MVGFFYTLLTLAILPSTCLAELKVDSIFTEGMVLQRDRAIVISGTAEPDSHVEISLGAKNNTHIKSTAFGEWKAQRKPLPAATTLATPAVKSGKQSIEIQDVLLGDVWLCCGQSNMGFKLSKGLGGKAHAKTASDPLIRGHNDRDTWRAWDQGDFRFLVVQAQPTAKP